MSDVPTRELLPYYMNAQRWIDLADAIDTVFGVEIKLQMRALEYIRHQFIINDELEAKVEDSKMIGVSDYDKPDTQTLALQSTTLGLTLSDSSYLDEEGFVNLTRNLGTHWFSKGLGDFVDFIAYVTNTDITMINTWTKDYITFVPEDLLSVDDVAVYYSGGEWYPTTHVRLRYIPSNVTLGDASLLSKLFYDLSNYNLVLQALEEILNIYMTDTPVDGSGVLPAKIVAIAHVDVEVHYIDTAE